MSHKFDRVRNDAEKIFLSEILITILSNTVMKNISGMHAMLILVFLLSSFTLPENYISGTGYQFSGTTVIDSKKIDGNNITAWYRNNGSYHRDPVTGNSGFLWPAGDLHLLTYASGLWIAARSGNDTLLAISEYYYEYLPGYIDAGGNPQGKDDPAFHVYKISRGDTTGSDYRNWPVSQGAYLNEQRKPFLPGSQTLFYSITDGYPESHQPNPVGTMPLKAQIQVTVWCYLNEPQSPLRNAVFMEFKIINKSSNAWNDAVISVWSDACSDNHVALGCDTLRKLSFAYIKPNTPSLGNTPPAFGFILLKGPDKYTGNTSDTVYSFVPGKSQRRKKIGYREVPFSSFGPRTNSDPINGDPSNYREAYVIIQGFKKSGDPFINPIIDLPTKFPYLGDPETGSGWNQFTAEGYANRRYNINFGFTNVNPGDTQTIVVAKLVSQGSSNLNSVTRLKSDAEQIISLFEQNLTTVSVNQISTIVPKGLKLLQNYPNPFNPFTKIRFEVPIASSGSTNRTSLIVYDGLGREVAKLVDEDLMAGIYETEFNASLHGQPNGLAGGVYFCRLTSAGTAATIKLMLIK